MIDFGRNKISNLRIVRNKKLWRNLNPELIREWANSFSQDSFKSRFEKTINRAWREHIKSCDITTSDLSS